MTLISKHLPNLSGGISKQAAPLRLYNQCADQINMRPSLVNGLENRPPLKKVTALTNADGAFYAIDRDSDGRYNLIIRDAVITITDDNGTPQTLNTTAANYLTGASSNLYDTYKVLTLADVTYILNTQKKTALLSDRYTGWRNQALVFIKQVSASTTWTLNINGSVISAGYGGANTDTGLPDLYINGLKTADDVNMSATEIAARLAGGSPAYSYYMQSSDTVMNTDKTYYYFFTNASSYPKISTNEQWTMQKEQNNVYELVTVGATVGFSGFTITQKGAVLWIRRDDGGAFTIGLDDTRSGTCSNLITTQVQQFDQLPTTAPDGYIARVIGSVASNADDYYVMFNTNNGDSFSKGVWKECAEPGAQFGLDPATMPHILVHEANGTWTFKQAEWKDKETGDLDSSPNPSFVGKKLRNIFLYSNRLCFLTEDLLCMSAAAEHTNWWNESATVLTDADPIYVSASTEKVADLYDFGMLDDDLILFGKDAQYRLNTLDVLSPKTAAVTAIGKNIYTKATGIVASGAKLYFGHKNGKSFTVNEFGTSSVTGNKEATAITTHVPGLIPYHQEIRLAGTENTDTIAVISAAQPDTIFMYQYYISAGNKLQSAWHKYTFNAEVKGIFFRENILWLFLKKGNAAVIATLDTAETTEQTANEPILDFAEIITQETPTLEWNLPFYISPDKSEILVPTVNGLYTPATVNETTETCVTLTKASSKIIAGEKIPRKYIFSVPYVTAKQRDGTEKTQTAGRFQLQKLLLSLGSSGAFTVQVKPRYDEAAPVYIYKYTGVKMGTKSASLGIVPMADGEFSIPLHGRNTDLEITIITDSYLPQSIISALWQGNYITKVTPI